MAVWFDLVVSRTHDLLAAYAYGCLRLEHRRSFRAASVPHGTPDLRRCDCIDLPFARAPLHPLAHPRSANCGPRTAPDPPGRNASTRVVVFCAGSGSAPAHPARGAPHAVIAALYLNRSLCGEDRGSWNPR